MEGLTNNNRDLLGFIGINNMGIFWDIMGLS
jgi:hypothetical protein